MERLTSLLRFRCQQRLQHQSFALLHLLALLLLLLGLSEGVLLSHGSRDGDEVTHTAESSGT